MWMCEEKRWQHLKCCIVRLSFTYSLLFSLLSVFALFCLLVFGMSFPLEVVDTVKLMLTAWSQCSSPSSEKQHMLVQEGWWASTCFFQCFNLNVWLCCRHSISWWHLHVPLYYMFHPIFSLGSDQITWSIGIKGKLWRYLIPAGIRHAFCVYETPWGTISISPQPI